MPTDGRVLVLCQLRKTADSIAYTLRRDGLDTVASADPAEAFAALRKQPCDMAIVHVKLNGATGLDFLAQARREFPLMQRVLLQNEPLAADPAQLVNDAGPCAVMAEPVEAEPIWRLLALEGPVTHGALEATASRARLDAESAQRQNRQLAAENRLLTQEVAKLRRQPPHAPAGQPPPAPVQPRPPRQAGEPDLPRLAAQLRETLERRFADPHVPLPALPPIALEIQRLASRDDTTFDSLAERIKQEQSLAARVLQVANSPVYAGLERTRTLNQAVARLGMRETARIIQAVLGENLFRTRHRALAKLMAQLWMHSLCVAYANHDVAHRLALPEREDYFALGLLHDVGRLLILQLAEQSVRAREVAPEDLREDVLLAVMAERHNEFGARLLRAWQYPRAFEEVAALHDDIDGIHQHPEPVAVTCFSNVLARKIGYSLVPFDPAAGSDERLAAMLNLRAGAGLLLEEHLKGLVEKIRKSYMGI